MAIYTSSYEAILKRRKEAKDVYIKISRNLGQYDDSASKSELRSFIDKDYGFDFGNWWGDKTAYKKGVRKKDLRWLAKYLRENMQEKNMFLLCFENVFEGEVCHRRWLAEILKKGFGLNIEEWGGEYKQSY